ncbi:hypothetical protein GCM10011575_04410 [Microlunatus endophyticus]|uniref:Low molecular weight protein antigen 6 PH domain-containing protein n=1 Tax=Microlunatus endophyticus TaxID=1716077 RepID=A0A917W1C1_9ACTN|nr:PH domain-containing protein [Microlunatus endophyticus]GGL49391.1 hypothetical protein GCM10011575_04410 [Microlunatus endophyticus]
MDSVTPGLVVSYPRRMRIVGSIFSAALVVIAFGGWIALPASLRAQFTTSELITLLLVLIAIVGIIMSVAMSVVRADHQGLTIRNALRTHRIGWQQVHNLVYRNGDPWPTLLINNRDDPDKIMLIAIQRTDHERADEAVAGLRRLYAEFDRSR